MKRTFLAPLLLLLMLGGCAKTTDNHPAITRGAVDGDTYTSDYAGITFVAPAGWRFAPDDEIAQYMGIGVETLAEHGMTYSQEMLELQNLWDMLAESPDGSSVMVLFENLAASGSAGMSETDYLDFLRSQMEAASVYDYEFYDYTTRSLGAADYTVLRADVGELGVSQFYCLRKQGDYMTTVIVNAAGDASAEEIMACFI